MSHERRKKARAAVSGLRQQTQFTCVATSIAACLHALDKPYDEDDVNKVLGALPMSGARWEEALAVVQYFGCRGMLVVPSTIPMMRKWVSAGWPVLIAWNPENRPWSHMSVVFDVEEDETVHVMDPNIPDPNRTARVVGREDFYRVWGESFGDKLIVRRPAAVVCREVTPEGRQVIASAGRHKIASMSLRDRMVALQGLSEVLDENEILTEMVVLMPDRRSFDLLRLVALDNNVVPPVVNNNFDLAYALAKEIGPMEVAAGLATRMRGNEFKMVYDQIAQENGIL